MTTIISERQSIIRMKPTYATKVAEDRITAPNLAKALSVFYYRYGVRLTRDYCPKLDQGCLKTSVTETAAKIAIVQGSFVGPKHVSFKYLDEKHIPRRVIEKRDKYQPNDMIYIAKFSGMLICGIGEQVVDSIAMWALRGEYSPSLAPKGEGKQKIEDFRIDEEQERRFTWVKYIREKTSFNLVPDVEYNEIVGAEPLKFESLQFENPQQEDKEVTLDSALLDSVAKVFNEVERRRNMGPATLGLRMGKTRVGSAVLTPHNATEVLDSINKRHYDVQVWSDRYDKQAVPYCFLMHKPGAVTSRGIVRNVYPIQPELEGRLRSMYRCAKLDQFPDYEKDIRKIPGEYLYGYDIKSCDITAAAYLKAHYVGAPQYDMVFPQLVLDKNTCYRPNQFPSGSPITSIFTNGFTQALINHLGIKAKFNGDGILSTTPVEHHMLRYVGIRTINNFEITDAPRYLRYDKIDSATYLRGGHKASGRLRYLLRYRGLADFGVPDAWQHCRTDNHVWGGTNIRTQRLDVLLNMLHKHGIDIPRKLLPLREHERDTDEHAAYGEDAFSVEASQTL